MVRRVVVLGVCAAMAASVLTGAARADDPPQWFNLPDTPTSARFTLPMDRVWPTAVGGADICLWDGDRFAAMSITIDDNCAPDHDWWLAQAALYDFKLTWFVITERPDLGGYWGTWEQFRYIDALGHDVQSHTVTHIHADEPGWLGIEWEYTQSIIDIETQIPGHEVLTLAYPGGTYSELNDRTIAAQYYISARGTVGSPNFANQIDYFAVHTGGLTRSYTDCVLFGFSDISWMNSTKYLRGWLCPLFHGVPEDSRPAIETELAYIKSMESEIWLGLYTDIARFGQERDTATLTVTLNTSDEIRFTLSDCMDDTIYDYPLTIKVRVPDAWFGVQAVQNASPIEATLVVHEGHPYALVKAVPDRGEVVLSPFSPDLTITKWEVLSDHGAAGTQATTVADGHVEPRLAGLRQFRVTFAAPVDAATLTPAALTITGQTGGDQSSLVESLSLDGSLRIVTVTLSSPLPDADGYTIAFTDTLRGTEGQAVTGDRDIVVRTLAGDADGSGAVTAADVLTVRGMAGQTPNALTAGYDLDGSGAITAADMRAARTRLGNQLPE
ncbi:MAG: polysaccharide deacetylase family protein [Planctomycetes bacterium]|nr:polysaccharide deacetylase family protein [Planctomycetota bacterium]